MASLGLTLLAKYLRALSLIFSHEIKLRAPEEAEKEEEAEEERVEEKDEEEAEAEAEADAEAT